MIPASQFSFNNKNKELKRKRLNATDGINSHQMLNSQQDIDDDQNDDFEEIEELYLDDSNSNRSDSSSTSSNNSISTTSSIPVLRVKKNKIKHGHKVLILDDSNMSEALNHLQLEVDAINDMNYQDNVSLTKLKEEQEEEIEQQDQNISNFIMSDQLKQTLKTYQNYDQYLMSKISNDEQKNNLQLVLYKSPTVIIHEDDPDEDIFINSKTNPTKIQSNCYTVEEPVELAKSEKNKLKRSYSQVSKISIEELKHLNNISNTSQPISIFQQNSHGHSESNQVQFYLVDEMDDQKQKNIDQSKSLYNQKAVHNLNIRDVSESGNLVYMNHNNHHQASSETMDFI